MDEQIESTTPLKLEDYLNSIEQELNEIVMDPASSGYESLAEQDIAYGVSFTAGINTSSDVVLDVGCGIGEFYYYVNRFTNENLFKYYGIDNVDEYLDICKFRSNQDESVNLMNINIDDFEEGYSSYGDDAIKNLNVLGIVNTNIDWVVICNVFNDSYSPEQIINKIKFWSRVPEKGAVFTFKLESKSNIAQIASSIVLDESLNTKTIIRSDFYPNWVSLYVYNSRG